MLCWVIVIFIVATFRLLFSAQNWSSSFSSLALSTFNTAAAFSFPFLCDCDNYRNKSYRKYSSCKMLNHSDFKYTFCSLTFLTVLKNKPIFALNLHMDEKIFWSLFFFFSILFCRKIFISFHSQLYLIQFSVPRYSRLQ